MDSPAGLVYPHSSVCGIRAIPDGRLLLGCMLGDGRRDDSVLVDAANKYADLLPERIQHALPGRLEHLVPIVSPDGSRMIASDMGSRLIGNRSSFVCYRLQSAREFVLDWVCSAALPGSTQVSVGYACDFSTSGERWLAGESHGGEQSSVARIRSAGDGTPLCAPFSLPSSWSELKLAADDSRIIVRASTSLLSYNVAAPSAIPVKVMSGNRKHFTGVAVHPNGRRVLATCNDETVREYDAVTLQELRAYAWKIGRLRCVAIAPDGLTAAAGSDTGKVVVWDLD